MPSETRRLEKLWAGEFGDSLTDRHTEIYKDERRKAFWQSIIRQTSPRNILELGCNQAFNLEQMIPPMKEENVYGIDINRKALDIAEQRLPEAHFMLGGIKSLPFDDAQFDLVFCDGVLIHQPDESLFAILDEMARVSKKYVFIGEYFSKEQKEVPYRGHRDVLFTRDYGTLFIRPGFMLVQMGFHGKDDGFDDETYWLFQKIE